MIVRTDTDRKAAVDALQAMVADWRTSTMPAEEQAKFDAIAAGIDDYDAQVAARPTPAPPEPERTVIEPERPPLAAKYQDLRDIRNEADRAVAVRDLQELAADWRARSMPFEVQFAFDGLNNAILAYDADVVAARRSAGPSLQAAILAQAAAFRAKR